MAEIPAAEGARMIWFVIALALYLLALAAYMAWVLAPGDDDRREP